MVKTPRTRHSKSTRDPVTIDLSPEEVTRAEADAGKEAETMAAPAEEAATTEPAAEQAAPEEQAAAEPEPAAKPEVEDDKPAFGRRDEQPAAPPPPRRGGKAGLFGAGAAGGAVALLLLGGLHAAGVLPVPPAPPQDQARSVDHGPALAALESELADLRGQISALEAGGGDDPALVQRVAETEGTLSQLAASLESVRSEIAALGEGAGGEAAPPVDLSPLKERIAALEGAAPQEADLSRVDESIAALRGEIATAREAQAADAARLDALEQAVAGLGERLDEQAEAPATALIIAASALKAAIDRGVPFTTELDTFAALAPDAPEIEGLRAHAGDGVATRAELNAGSNAAANAMIAASRPADPDAGVVDRLWASAMGLVKVRPIGMVEGDGVPEVAARIDAAITAGDYERAISEFDALPQEAKAAGEPFMARLRARLEAERLVDEALAGALRA